MAVIKIQMVLKILPLDEIIQENEYGEGRKMAED